MKLFLDFFPLAIFLGIYFFSDVEEPIYPAVIGLMIASIVQTIGSRLLTGQIEKLHLWTLLITLAFGVLTLVFKSPEFVQWKASVIVWLMAGVFLFRQLISKKLLIQEMLQASMDQHLEIPEKIWRKVNVIWPIAYVSFGFINLYIAYNFSEAFWVKFKVFGLMGLTLTLLIYTIINLFPYFPTEEKENIASNKALEQLNDKDN